KARTCPGLNVSVHVPELVDTCSVGPPQRPPPCVQTSSRFSSPSRESRRSLRPSAPTPTSSPASPSRWRTGRSGRRATATRSSSGRQACSTKFWAKLESDSFSREETSTSIISCTKVHPRVPHPAYRLPAGSPVHHGSVAASRAHPHRRHRVPRLLHCGGGLGGQYAELPQPVLHPAGRPARPSSGPSWRVTASVGKKPPQAS
ncbi:PREDICTED: uncharacterized protein LOC109484958, partial [Branchiostoma belcheri]|uniref:Uncharacterized protein LOC109484958 n=1 Tax=Branchiostoma belcheri TaxID=7741 RepID=A0A6P4ZRS4_BRABE